MFVMQAIDAKICALRGMHNACHSKRTEFLAQLVTERF
jgi:hypothetical protein